MTTLPRRGPAPVNPQIEMFLWRIAPALMGASTIIQIMQSQRRDPALVQPMMQHCQTILAISRHIFEPGGANKAALTQIEMLMQKLVKAQNVALALIMPPDDDANRASNVQSDVALDEASDSA